MEVEFSFLVRFRGDGLWDYNEQNKDFFPPLLFNLGVDGAPVLYFGF